MVVPTTRIERRRLAAAVGQVIPGSRSCASPSRAAAPSTPLPSLSSERGDGVGGGGDGGGEHVDEHSSAAKAASTLDFLEIVLPGLFRSRRSFHLAASDSLALCSAKRLRLFLKRHVRRMFG
ncbi:hypothetical protein GWI33_007790 [Rhynchophorus ferrugineus]|uniref:Uncharacterized protein n=1 Tax=Rhynchophorus ferrugineus TaxID=354439 RepID=A0A834MGF2_RHYFE|nr:hypothetical protein GWI33_007790 [Rhynchophorus ferrugineus]